MSLDSAPEYALSFSGEAVHLQKRDQLPEVAAGSRQPAWRHLGSADFDEPDFRETLSQLRMMATGEGADVPLAVTLVIPDDQILYTTLTIAPSGDRERAVARSLDGLTPYPIEDLSFDWEGEGDSVRVAAVARQTLREALEFAREYGFEGERFCADPEHEQFRGEPGFLLAAPGRPRPFIDPAQAGVTAAALMLPEEPEEAPAPSDPPIAAVEAPAVASEAPQVAAEDDAVVEPQDATTPEPEATGTEQGAIAETAPRHLDEMLAPHADPLNPRARAVHDRAAEARKARLAGAAPTAPARARPVRRAYGHSGLTVMIALLFVGLVLAWAFIGTGPRDAEPDANVIAVPQAAPAPAEAPAETAQIAAPAPDEVPPVATDVVIADAPVAAASATEAEPAADELAQPTVAEESPQPAATEEVAAETAALPPAPVATPVVQAAPSTPTIADMADPDARRVLVAAAAVAAAIVPPIVDRPEPAATAPVAAVPAPVETPAEAPATPVASRPTPERVTERAAARQANPVAAAPRAQPRPERRETPAPRATAPAAPARVEPQLASSARPQLSPRRSTPTTSVPRVDTPPQVPSDPMSYAASQLSARPPMRGGSQPSAADGDARVAPVPVSTRAGRPPQKPEGSVPELPAAEPDGMLLDEADRAQLRALVLDLNRHGLATAPARPGIDARLADARPQRKPKGGGTATDAVSPSAVESALRSAAGAPPERPAAIGRAEAASTASTPATSARAATIRGSSRPVARPSGGGRISDEAVEKAIAAAVDASPAIPNAIRLSALPPRRSDRPAAAASDNAPEPSAPAAAAVAATAPGPSDAEIAARRALDEQLQAQAEARIRARAQADAAAEAQARAQAEARARAQAEAEERSARASKQVYKPQEIDDEPEIASNSARGGTTAANVAQAATQSRALDTGRTTIIGIIGAGNASRALIRLRNGKVVTVRLGDKIDGGTINSIGNGRLTYVKAGKQRELRMLDGR